MWITFIYNLANCFYITKALDRENDSQFRVRTYTSHEKRNLNLMPNKMLGLKFNKKDKFMNLMIVEPHRIIIQSKVSVNSNRKEVI